MENRKFMVFELFLGRNSKIQKGWARHGEVTTVILVLLSSIPLQKIIGTAQSRQLCPQFKHNYSISFELQPTLQPGTYNSTITHLSSILLFQPFSTPKHEQSLIPQFLLEKIKHKKIPFSFQTNQHHLQSSSFLLHIQPQCLRLNFPKGKACNVSSNYNLIKDANFLRNLFNPSSPTPSVLFPPSRPISNSQHIDTFSLQDEALSPQETYSHIPMPYFCKPCDQNNQETMQIEQECFFGKRRHGEMMDYSHTKRLMLSKLQRIDRAPAKRRHF